MSGSLLFKDKKLVVYILTLGVIALVGTFLRVYLLTDQILIDDEWHGMMFTIRRSFASVWTHFSLGATSVPMNVYRAILLRTVGWSEMLMRLPAIIPGILSLIIFPYYVAKIFNRRTTLFFSCLLAISPFIIFYSRVARPYSMFVFLAFIAIFSCYLWLISGKKKYLAHYLSAGIIATYFHLFAVIALFTPLLVGLAIKYASLKQWLIASNKNETIVVSFKALFISAGVAILILSLLILPGIINYIIDHHSFVQSFVGEGHWGMHSVTNFLSMLSGTDNSALIILFVLFVISGFIILSKQSILLSMTCIALFILYFLALFISQPNSIHAAIVISRYSIILFPISFLLIAIALDSFSSHLSARLQDQYQLVGVAGSLIFILALLYSGPLWQTYQAPNNFTNHSAFQESYKTMDWGHFYRSDMIKPDYDVQRSDIPEFYIKLAENKEVKAIIEYPILIGDNFNIQYFYQHYHKKRMLAGYIVPLDKEKKYLTKGDVSADALGPRFADVLIFIEDETNLKFTNMVNILDFKKIKASGARFVIIHRNALAEALVSKSIRSRIAPDEVVEDILIYYIMDHSWMPVFQDRSIIVFDVKALDPVMSQHKKS